MRRANVDKEKIPKMKKIIIFLLTILLGGLFPGQAYMMSSTHYQINADSINVGGVKQTSASYKSEDTIGESGTGDLSSASYKVSAGYQAMWDYPPGLAFSINGNNAALGTLTTAAASTATTGFSISSNASNGYVVQAIGNTLASGPNTIDAITVPATSSPGSKQFGMNLVYNTSPNVGANP